MRHEMYILDFTQNAIIVRPRKPRKQETSKNEGLFAVAVAVGVARALQGDRVLRGRRSLGLRLSGSRLRCLVGLAGMGAAN
jgi:hypothetical protein